MLLSERRRYPRFNPIGLQAFITLDSTYEPSKLVGEVLDISYTGIKIRLDTPSAGTMEGKIKIEIYLPENGIPISISGILRHRPTATDLGIQYLEHSNVVEMDKFLFECVKLVKTE